VTYFVTSLTMPDPQSGDVSHTVNDVSAPFWLQLALPAANSSPKPSFKWRFI